MSQTSRSNVKVAVADASRTAALQKNVNQNTNKFLNMRAWRLAVGTGLCSLLVAFSATPAEISSAPAEGGTGARTYAARGVIEELKPAGQVAVIRHEAISNYMAAMTMPFKVKALAELAGKQTGDEISFQLHVTETESWVDHIVKTGMAPLAGKTAALKTIETPPAHATHPLLDYKFTNELGQAVSLNDFRGQALAITFFYTRCPLPEYCSRLSKNFQAAAQQLKALTNAPANWHFLSISFDPEFDSPALLKAYGESYDYDPAHWSFLTGPAEKIGELARSAGANYEFADGTINHNFRTLIIDASGRLQMVFPTGGDLTAAITGEILKAAAVTNAAIAPAQ